MTEKEQLNEMMYTVDNLVINNALNIVQLNTMTSMLLNVYIETLPKDDARAIINNYFEELFESSREALQKIDQALYNKSMLPSLQISLRSRLTEMKANFLEKVS